MLKDDICAFLAKETHFFCFEHLDTFHTAQSMSQLFDVKRNTVSHYLNQLVEENKLIKINTRPVYFLHRAVFEERFFTVDESVFSTAQSLKDYPNRQKDIFAGLIGEKSSLKTVIEKLNTAIYYPPVGLSVMLHGPTGCGKSMLAQLAWKQAINRQILSPGAPFITFNCAQYSHNPELLSSYLFGYVKGAFTGADKNTDGVLQQAHGGILFLDEVHRLHAESQEKLFSFMDTGRFHRMGDSEREHSAQVRLIFATTVAPKSHFLDTFIRRIPLSIAIPSLEERGNAEKRQFIHSFFREESRQLQRNITLSPQVVEVLQQKVYVGNIGELKNTITCICASQYAKSAPGQPIDLRLKDLPETFSFQGLSSERALLEKFITITPTTELRDLISYPLPLSRFIDDFWDKLLAISPQQDADSFLPAVCNEVEQLFDKIIFCETAKNEHHQIYFTLNTLQDIARQTGSRNPISFNGNRLYGLAWYLFSQSQCNKIRNTTQKKVLESLYQYLIQHLPDENLIARKLSVLIEHRLDMTIDREDEIFFTLFLKSMNMVIGPPRTRSVILAHGYATASSIANVVNRMLGTTIFASFDMPIDTSIKDIGNNIQQYIHDNDMSRGLVILVDMGSLTEIYSELSKSIHFPVAIINNVSTAVALHVGELLMNNASLESIVNEVDAHQKNDSKIIYSEQLKRPIIITSCYTGIGTAHHLQRLLEESIPKEVGVDVIAYDHQLLQSASSQQSLLQFYDVLAVVGTADPSIPFIPYISLDDLIIGRGDIRLDTVFRDVADSTMIQTINDKLVHNFSLKRVISQLTILDTGKILEHLDTCISTLEMLIKKRLENQKKINLYVHVSCMLERLIRQAPVDNIPEHEQLQQCQKELLCMIQNAFSVIEDIYSVTIPLSEIRYIYDIIVAD
ncbi:PRD domain-containing protein [Salmonella enterica]|nr:PRD domain-containing protein [Salmonella enterica]